MNATDGTANFNVRGQSDGNSSTFSQGTESYLTIEDLVPSDTFQGVIISMYASIIVIAVGGNSLVCYTLLVFQRVKSVTGYFIVNLALSDMLMAVVCIPFTFVSNLILMYWPFGDILCPLVTYLQVVSVFVSAYTMIAIGIDRLVAIVYPFRPRLSKLQASLMIGLVWFISLLIPLPTAITSKVVPLESSPNIGLCQEEWHEQGLKYKYSIALMVLQYFFPVGFLTFAYGRVGLVIWLKDPAKMSCRDRSSTENKLKMAKIMVVIVVLYTVCWLPLHVITLVGDRDPEIYDQRYVHMIWVFSHWLAMSNCCYNPFIYFWMSGKFRLGFKYVLRYCPCGVFKNFRYERKLRRHKVFRMASTATLVKRDVTDNLTTAV